MLRGQPVDFAVFAGNFDEGNRRRSAQSKGLETRVSAARSSDPLAWVGRVKRGEADLLARKVLLAELARRVREQVLHLKDLLTVFPPSLKRWFEDEPIFEISFWCRISPNSAIF